MISCNECGYLGSEIKSVESNEENDFNCQVCPKCNSHHIEFYVSNIPLSTGQINQFIDRGLNEKHHDGRF